MRKQNYANDTKDYLVEPFKQKRRFWLLLPIAVPALVVFFAMVLASIRLFLLGHALSGIILMLIAVSCIFLSGAFWFYRINKYLFEWDGERLTVHPLTGRPVYVMPSDYKLILNKGFVAFQCENFEVSMAKGFFYPSEWRIRLGQLRRLPFTRITGNSD